MSAPRCRFSREFKLEAGHIALDWVSDSNWTEYLFEYFDRADANLAGNGRGPEGDEPPKPGLMGGGQRD